jgi:hypothetical protein
MAAAARKCAFEPRGADPIKDAAVIRGAQHQHAVRRQERGERDHRREFYTHREAGFEKNCSSTHRLETRRCRNQTQSKLPALTGKNHGRLSI